MINVILEHASTFMLLTIIVVSIIMLTIGFWDN